jgi:hypothetical protein
MAGTQLSAYSAKPSQLTARDGDAPEDHRDRRIRELENENRELRMQVEQLRGALRRGSEDLERLAAEFAADAEVRALALRRAAARHQRRLI